MDLKKNQTDSIEETESGSDESRSRILVVDDNPVNRVLLRETLGHHGFEVIAVADGNEALSQILRFRPCLILLDIMMPGIDGFEVMSLLRQDSVYRDIPVIFLTALTDRADRLRGLELGAVDYITKPFDDSEVLVKVRNQVRIQQLSASLKEANVQLMLEQDRVYQDLKAAREIQLGLLPKELDESTGLKFDACLRPCFEVGGDFLGISQVSDDLTSVHAIDVSGHGTAAAMVTMSIIQDIERTQEADPNLSAQTMFQKLDSIYPIDRFGRFFTMAYGVYDRRDSMLRYSTAGHPWPLLVRKGGNGRWLDKGGTVIGVGGPVKYEEESLKLEPGDRVYFYSDGLIEIVNQDGEDFGMERMEALLYAWSQEPLEGGAEGIINSVVAWSGDPHLNDDLSVMVLEVQEPS